MSRLIQLHRTFKKDWASDKAPKSNQLLETKTASTESRRKTRNLLSLGKNWTRQWLHLIKQPKSSKLQSANRILRLWRVWRDHRSRLSSSPNLYWKSLVSILTLISWRERMTIGLQPWDSFRAGRSLLMPKISMLVSSAFNLLLRLRILLIQMNLTWTSFRMLLLLSIILQDGSLLSLSRSDHSRSLPSSSKQSKK